MIKTPYFTLNLRKWREENGMTGEVVEAYIKAFKFHSTVLILSYLIIGMLIGKYLT